MIPCILGKQASEQARTQASKQTNKANKANKQASEQESKRANFDAHSLHLPSKHFFDALYLSGYLNNLSGQKRGVSERWE